MGRGRHSSRKHGPRGHRARGPGLRSDHRLIPDLDMIDYTHLTGKDHFVADPSAACDANLSGNDRIFPYYHVVRDLNQSAPIPTPAWRMTRLPMRHPSRTVTCGWNAQSAATSTPSPKNPPGKRTVPRFTRTSFPT